MAAAATVNVLVPTLELTGTVASGHAALAHVAASGLASSDVRRASLFVLRHAEVGLLGARVAATGLVLLGRRPTAASVPVLRLLGLTLPTAGLPVLLSLAAGLLVLPRLAAGRLAAERLAGGRLILGASLGLLQPVGVPVLGRLLGGLLVRLLGRLSRRRLLVAARLLAFRPSLGRLLSGLPRGPLLGLLRWRSLLIRMLSVPSLRRLTRPPSRRLAPRRLRLRRLRPGLPSLLACRWPAGRPLLTLRERLLRLLGSVVARAVARLAAVFEGRGLGLLARLVLATLLGPLAPTADGNHGLLAL